MNRDDVIRITEEVLKNLKLELSDPYFMQSNYRTILLKYNNEVISQVDFDIIPKPEYDEFGG